ncbi:MAG: phosphopantetheine-binding protein [Acidobacteriota bacterium]
MGNRQGSRPSLTDEEVLQRFAKVVSKSLHIESSQVTKDSYLDSLGAESLDFLEIALDTEDEFNIAIPEKTILDTAEEVFGEGVLVQDGILTKEGRKFLIQRMPELDVAQLGDPLTVEELNHIVSGVGAWVRMIKGLMEHTPTECPQCGAGLKNAVAGRFQCAQCEAEVDVPSGDEINMRWVRGYYEKEYLPSQAGQ